MVDEFTIFPKKEKRGNKNIKITQLKSQLGVGWALTSYKLPIIRGGITKIKCKILGQCQRGGGVKKRNVPI